MKNINIYMFFPVTFFVNFLDFLLQVASLKDDHGLAQSELNSARVKIKECDSQISSILKEQQRLQNKISETNLEKKRMENEVC